MKTTVKKISSVLLSVLLIATAVMPGFSVYSANPKVTITDDTGAEITATVEVQEYRSVQLSYILSSDAPDGAYVGWESNLPLLADVDDTGKVTGYDYSKAAIIQLWLDEQVRTLPIVGESMATAIETAITNSGYDIDTVNTDILVALVRGIAGDTIADSLKNYLDNMNVEITATLYDASGNALNTDKVDVLVTQSLVASVAPTGVHITNKKSVPITVAVGTTVQLYGAVTPVRLKQGVKWSMGSSAFDTSSSKYASVSDSGLVTFTAAGTATVRVNPSSALYAAFSDTITFTVVEQSALPVTDFTISGTTSVSEGATTQLAIDNLTPAGAYTGNLVWSSSDPTIAVVDQNGIVTGLDGGSGLIFSKTTTITAAIGAVSKSVTVTVNRSLISSTISGVDISGESAIANDASAQYTATVYPSRYNTNSSVSREWGLVDTDNTIIWATAEAPAETILATMNNTGVLTPKSSGIITIAVRAKYNDTTVQNTMQVTSGVAITDFAISGSSSVTENSTTQLSITGITPAEYDEALLSTIKWSSANPKTAAVDENGLVIGVDAGGYGTFSSAKTTIYATIGGVTKSFEITVKGAFINYVTSASIQGFDNVIKDFPVSYGASFTPSRMSISKTLWGLPTDEGVAPWTASNTLNSSSNMENSVASVTDSGLVTGISAGTTTLHLFGRHNLTSFKETTKQINVVEIEPQSITITAPAKTDYVEGQTQLDLTGLKVELTYNRDDIEKYYGDTSSTLTDSQLKVEVTDYTVSEINQNVLDADQYIVVTVNRAGKTYRGVFAITLAAKALTSIDITAPQYKYVEGTTHLDLSTLTVKANYSNSDSELVTDYTVDSSAFNPQLFNVEQTIPVTYSHAGRTASASFKVIVYGIPIVSVDTGAYAGGWSSGDITFTLDSTNKLDGVTYYYKTDTDAAWTALPGNTYTVSTNSDETYYFKAINSEEIESEATIGYNIKRDDVTPSFTLVPEISTVTNQSYKVNINSVTVGSSGIKSIMLNGNDITGSAYFTVSENGDNTVVITANNGLSKSETITVNNIDKDAPTVNSITMVQKNDGKIARFINSITFGTFFNKKIEITIDASDIGVAGVDTVEYRFLDENGLPTGSDWMIYDSSNKPTQDPNFKGYVEARATDKAGNMSACLRSDGYVIDGDNPTDVLVNATYKGSVYNDGTWVADSVQISVASQAFSDIFEYRYRVDGGEWQSMTGNTLTADTEGEHTYEFKAISNSALDSGITTLTVKIDRQVPVVRVDFKGTFGRWTGEDVTFSFATLENSISGITYYYNNGGSDWVEITSGDSITLNTNTNATYKFKAVNGAGTQSNPSDSYVVMIDTVVPTITSTKTVTTPTCEPYTINLAVLSGEAGVKSVTMNGVDITGQTSVTVSQNGNYLFTITGNNQKTSTELLVIDNFFNPVLEISGIEFNQIVSGSFARKLDGEFGTFYKENTEITITAQNTGVTGIAKVEYRLLDENKNPTGEWTQYDSLNKPYITGGFKGYIEARAYDNASAVSQSVISKAAVVDTAAPTAPVITATSNGTEYTGSWTGSEITFELNSSAFSGIFGYMYRVDGGSWINIQGSTVTVNENGQHTYDFKAVSNSTLESVASSFGTKTENTAPALQVGVSGTLGKKTGEKVEFSLYAPNVISGVSYYYNNGNGWKTMPDSTMTIDETITANYQFKAVNSAGVESLVSPAYSVIVDKSYETVERKPIVQLSVNGTIGAFTANDVTFTLSATDIKDGVTYYYNDGTGFKAMSGNVLTINSNTDKTYNFKAIDGTNKESLVTDGYIVRIDKTAPTLHLVASSQANPNDAISVNINAVVGASGIKSITMNGADITGRTSFDITDNGTYKVTVTANNGLSKSETITVNSFDREAPQIDDLSLKQINTGSFARFVNTMTFGLFFNEKVEISAVASDNGVSGVKNIEYRMLDENSNALGAWVEYNGSNRPTVDKNFTGFVEVRATDNAGNISQTVTSDGFVVDLQNPSDVIITATTPTGSYDGTFTKENVTLSLSSTAFSDIYEYRYRVDGGVWASLSGDSLVALDGVHKYEFKAVSYVMNESAVSSITTKVETGTPTITVNTNGVFGSWTTDSITFSLSATNISSGVTYYYNDGSGFKAMNGNMLTVDTSANKTYTFKAINGTSAESAVSNSFLVMLDKQTPSISVEADTTKYTNKDIKLSVSTSDIGISGIRSVTMNGNDITGVSSVDVTENGVYTFTITDNNGLSATQSVNVTNIDKSLPDIVGVIFTHTNGTGAVKDNIYKNTAVVSVSAYDSGVSGIAKIEYRTVDAQRMLFSTSMWKTYDENSKPQLDGDFTGTVEIRATDNAGNVSEIYTSDTIIVDGNIPDSITLDAVSLDKTYDSGKWTSDDVEITVSSNAYSGIEKYLYKLDSGEWTEMTGNVITAAEDGTHTYKFKAVSNAGLESDIKTITTAIEKDAPVLTLDVVGTTGEWTSDSVTFILSATNAKSGMTYFCDTGKGFEKLSSNTLMVYKNQTTTYKFKAVNGVGNESAESLPYNVMIDEKGPTSVKLTATANGKKLASGSKTNADVTIDFTSQAFSDIQKYQYSLNGSDWLDCDGSVKTNGDGDYNYQFRAISNSGVTSEVTAFSVTVDSKYVESTVNTIVNQIAGSVDIPKTGGTIITATAIPLLGAAAVIIITAKKRKKK